MYLNIYDNSQITAYCYFNPEDLEIYPICLILRDESDGLWAQNVEILRSN